MLEKEFLFFKKLPFVLQAQILGYASREAFAINKQHESWRKNDSEIWKYRLHIEFPHCIPLSKDFYSEYYRIRKSEYRGYKKRQVEIITLIKHGDWQLLESKQKELKLGLEELYQKDANQRSWLDWLLRVPNQKFSDLIFKEVVLPFFNASLDKKDKEGADLLHWAAICNQFEFLEQQLIKLHLDQLYAPGANETWLIQRICDGQCQTLLDFIFNKIVSPFLLEDSLDEKGFNLLHWAVRCNQKEKMLELINQGFDVNGLSKNREVTPLYLAVQNNNLALVNLLLQCGGDPNLRRKGDDCSPLFYAAERGNLDIVKALVLSKKISNIDFHSGDLVTPVFRAALFYHLDVMEFLLEQGANANFVHAKSGSTMLSYAIKKQWPDMVRLLLKFKVDLNTPNRKGLTPLSLASQSEVKCEEIIDLLSAQKVKSYTP